MGLTRQQILEMKDIKVKKIRVSEWQDEIFIRQLTRGQQDEYLIRQYGETKLRQDLKAKEQEVSAVNIYGHDTFLFICGVCDKEGIRLFDHKDAKEIEDKNGEAIGFVAKEIVAFSGMGAEVAEIEELDQLKN
jgi:hypothetical protein